LENPINLLNIIKYTYNNIFLSNISRGMFFLEIRRQIDSNLIFTFFIFSWFDVILEFPDNEWLIISS
jgi:hypothetical protein